MGLAQGHTISMWQGPGLGFLSFPLPDSELSMGGPG